MKPARHQWTCRTGDMSTDSRNPCGYWLPGRLVNSSMTLSRLKEPGFWRGGNSLKLCSQSAYEGARRSHRPHVFNKPAICPHRMLHLGALERVGSRRSAIDGARSFSNGFCQTSKP